MAGQYAKDTEVSTDRSLAEIRTTLRRYDPDYEFAFGEKKGVAIIEFTLRGRQVRFMLALPQPDEPRFTKTPTRRDRSPAAAREEHEKAVRRIYRVFVLVVKAKLEAVESGLTEFQTEFMAQLVLPGGMTVGDAVNDRITEAYETGQVPSLLPDYGRRALPSGVR